MIPFRRYHASLTAEWYSTVVRVCKIHLYSVVRRSELAIASAFDAAIDGFVLAVVS